MDDLFEAFRFCITDNGCKGCPREEACKIHVDYVPVSKVLALDVLNRLKEQEAVEPTWQEGKAFCGSCGLRIPMHRQKKKPYCPSCGKAVKWE